jgi:hypothetical protein
MPSFLSKLGSNKQWLEKMATYSTNEMFKLPLDKVPRLKPYLKKYTKEFLFEWITKFLIA